MALNTCDGTGDGRLSDRKCSIDVVAAQLELGVSGSSGVGVGVQCKLQVQWGKEKGLWLGSAYDVRRPNEDMGEGRAAAQAWKKGRCEGQGDCTDILDILYGGRSDESGIVLYIYNLLSSFRPS